MSKGKHRLKMGWFGWTFLSIILVTLIGSGVFFFSIFNLDFKDFFSEEKVETQTDMETDVRKEKEQETTNDNIIDEVKKVQDTVGEAHQEIGKFVSNIHDFYNETTGYGAISSLNWDEQTRQATNITSTIKDLLPTVTDKALKTDLQHIENLASQVAKGKESGDVRGLHRMFHDLDIALNSYDGYDKIWGVTETLDKIR